jgi:hypothetical protein
MRKNILPLRPGSLLIGLLGQVGQGQHRWILDGLDNLTHCNHHSSRPQYLLPLLQIPELLPNTGDQVCALDRLTGIPLINAAIPLPSFGIESDGYLPSPSLRIPLSLLWSNRWSNRVDRMGMKN